MPIDKAGRFVTINLEGKQFGHLTVTGPSEKASNGGTKWWCQCDCGEKILVWAEVLKRSPNMCCRTCRNKVISEARTTHGQSGIVKTETYRTWLNMRGRCNSESHQSYKHYGGRGIQVCERWNSFGAFLSDMGERPDGMTIERKNNDGNYEPENCVWATDKEQCNNRRSNVFIEFNGLSLTYSQWAEKLNIDKTVIRQRHLKGWPIDRVLSTQRF